MGQSAIYLFASAIYVFAEVCTVRLSVLTNVLISNCLHVCWYRHMLDGIVVYLMNRYFSQLLMLLLETFVIAMCC